MRNGSPLFTSPPIALFCKMDPPRL